MNRQTFKQYMKEQHWGLFNYDHPSIDKVYIYKLSEVVKYMRDLYIHQLTEIRELRRENRMLNKELKFNQERVVKALY